MTGHTNWTLRLNAGDETRIQADSGTGISLAVCDIKCGGLAGRTVAEAERMAADLVARYNSLAGIENPAAFVQAARGMAEALEAIKKRAEKLKAGTDDWFELTEFSVCAGEALTAFRAATGEQA